MSLPDSDKKEDDLDKDFFAKKVSTEQLKKLKLNKGEKRALKFILKREMGEGADLQKYIENSDIA